MYETLIKSAGLLMKSYARFGFDVKNNVVHIYTLNLPYTSRNV